MKVALVALLLIGCQDPKDFPPLGGGGGGGGIGGNGSTDSPTADAVIDAVVQTGRVCLVRDLRQLTLCDDNAAGIVVEIGGVQATTIDDGTFSIDIPTGTGLTWLVSDPDLVTTVQQLSTSFVIPAIRITDFGNLLADNGIILTAGQATVVTQVRDDDGPFVGATAATTPAAQFPTRYDSNSAISWDLDATGSFSVAWLPGVSGASATLTVTPPIGSSLSTLVPLRADSITFATVSF